MSDIDNLKADEPEYSIAAPASLFANTVLGAIAAATLFGMMAVTAIDVFGRYLFNSPLQGGYELTQLLMISLIFAALPSVTRRGEHITVGLFENAFRGRARAYRDAIIALAVVFGSAYLAWRLYILGGRFSGFGDTTATSRIPLAPFAYGGALSMALCAIASLMLAIEALISQPKDRPK
jgi:TRAP-type C4-dicarboxylate transport system permease small subunit